VISRTPLQAILAPTKATSAQMLHGHKTRKPTHTAMTPPDLDSSKSNRPHRLLHYITGTETSYVIIHVQRLLDSHYYYETKPTNDNAPPATLLPGLGSTSILNYGNEHYPYSQ
jgi:hypothetical protein